MFSALGKKTQENPSFTFRSVYGWHWEKFVPLADVLGWLCMEMRYQPHRDESFCVFQEVTRKISRISRILQSIYCLKAGAEYLQVGSCCAAAVNHTSQIRKVVLVVKASNSPCTWGSSMAQVEFPCWCGNPWAGLLFPSAAAFIYFPKLMFFPILCAEVWTLLGSEP